MIIDEFFNTKVSINQCGKRFFFGCAKKHIGYHINIGIFGRQNNIL